MKDKWLDELREGLSNFEMDAPEGLWESLGVEKTLPKASRHRRWFAAAAVVAILIFGAGTILLLTRDEAIETSVDRYADANGKHRSKPTGNSRDNNHTPGPKSVGLPCLTQTTGGREVKHSVKKEEAPDIYVSADEAECTIVETTDQEEIKSDMEQTHSSETFMNEIGSDADRHHSLYVDSYSQKRKSDSGLSDRFAINISASGVTDSSDGRSFRIPVMNGNDIFAGSSLATSTFRHHKPLKTGITLQYNVSERVGIETGLVYSRIGSDISVSLDNRSSTGIRRMQYIGIPLNVKFSAWSWRFIDLYLSAGPTIEKCVSNRFETKSTAEGLSLDAYSSQREKPVQWSVNAAAGLQLKPLPNIGIFAEPGVSYYFNDGTSINTIYKEHPCSFNLSVGLRFILNP